MSTQHGSAAGELPAPVPDLPPRANGKPWYPTLEDAVDAWSHNKKLHGEQKLPPIHVYLHSHIGGWSVE
jgi:hypothetical protein